MGRYIDEILQPGERVLYSTNEHWIYFLPAIAAWIVARDEIVAAKPTAGFDAKRGNFPIDPGFLTRLVYEGV